MGKKKILFQWPGQDLKIYSRYAVQDLRQEGFPLGKAFCSDDPVFTPCLTLHSLDAHLLTSVSPRLAYLNETGLI